MSEPFRFTDVGGDHLEIRPAPDPAIAIIEVRYHGEQDGPTAHLPAHRLAEIVAAMYEAAGQAVPDLPVIADETQVRTLAELVHRAGCAREHSTSHDEAIARYLLAHGVTLPEVAHADHR